MHTLLTLLFLIVVTTANAGQYLRSERLSLPMDGSKASSSLPLDPTRQYEVEIISNYTLRPLLDSAAVCETTQVLIFQSKQCWVPVALNGFYLPKVSQAPRDLGAYIVDPQTDAYYVPNLKMVLWGNGKPLVVNTASNFSEAIPEAQLVITDPLYRAQEQQEEREAFARVKLFWQHVQEEEARQVLFLKRQEQIQDSLEHQRAKIAAMPAHGGLPVSIILLLIVPLGIILISIVSAPRRHAYQEEKRRVEQHQATIREREQAAHEYEETLEQEEAQKAEVEAVFRELEAEYEQRLYDAAVRLDLFSHYEDPAFLQKAAATYKKSLMGGRDDIVKEHVALHRDRNFIEYLRHHRPELYERSIWRMKALALAEQLAVETPKKPKLTEAEVRSFKVHRRERDIIDVMALRKVELDAASGIRAFLDQYEFVDSDEYDKMEKQLLDDIVKERADGKPTEVV